MADSSHLQIVAIKPQFWSSRIGAWLVPIGIACFLYLLTFGLFAGIKPALVLKNPRKAKAALDVAPGNKQTSGGRGVVETGDERTDSQAKGESAGQQNLLSDNLENAANLFEKSLNQINSVLDSSQILAYSFPLASRALQEAQKKLHQENFKTIASKMVVREAKKCWEEKVVDWDFVAELSAIPSVCFVLLLVAAM